MKLCRSSSTVTKGKGISVATDNKYGQIDVPGIPEDEPIFILRAQDVLAIATISRYKNLRLTAEEDPPSSEWVNDLDHVGEEFFAWAQANPDKIKLPD